MDRERYRASAVLSVRLIAVLPAEVQNLVKVRIVGEHAERVFYASERAQGLERAPQFGKLALQVVHLVFELFERHDGMTIAILAD